MRNIWGLVTSTFCLLLLTGSCSQVSAASETDRVLELVNAERARAGVRSVKMNEQLTETARKYALYLGQGRFFGHIGVDGSTVISRNIAGGYRDAMWLGENIAGGFSSADEVVAAWMDSLPHRSNILDPNFAEIGIASVFVPGSPYGRYWVQEFGVKINAYKRYDPRNTQSRQDRSPGPSSKEATGRKSRGVVSSGGSSGADVSLRENPSGSAPVVRVVDPAVAAHGASVKVSGRGFGKSGKLRFGGLVAEVESWSDDLIVATVPDGAISAAVTVANEQGVISTGVGFRAIPSSSGVAYNSQKAGTTAARKME